jgi:hypothetical protein
MDYALHGQLQNFRVAEHEGVIKSYVEQKEDDYQETKDDREGNRLEEDECYEEDEEYETRFNLQMKFFRCMLTGFKGNAAGLDKFDKSIDYKALGWYLSSTIDVPEVMYDDDIFEDPMPVKC